MGYFTALAAGIRAIGDYDMVFCGRQAIDGDTAQVGPQIAEHLGIPQITYVKIRNWKWQSKGKESIRGWILYNGIWNASFNYSIKKLNEPRYPSIKGIEGYTGKT